MVEIFQSHLCYIQLIFSLLLKENKEEERKEETTEEKKEEEKKDEEPPEIVLKVDMHCEACARKVAKALKGFEGHFYYFNLLCSKSFYLIKSDK